jgi:hypothetical protein
MNENVCKLGIQSERGDDENIQGHSRVHYDAHVIHMGAYCVYWIIGYYCTALHCSLSDLLVPCNHTL